MKKILFSALVALVLLWNYSSVFAQGKGGDKGPAGENKRTKGAREVGKARRPVDPNTIRRYPGAKRIPKTGPEQREMREKRREELLKMREERRKERGKNLRRRDIMQPGDELTKGKDHQQQLKALETQLAHEEAKHLKRVARLKRIQELATGENSKQIIARVEKLRQKEQLRYVRKHDRMKRRRDRLMLMQKGRPGVRPPDKKMLKEEARKAMEKRALTEKSKGKTKSEKKGAGEGAEQ
ncbi:MAG: hypothetical protein ACYS83_05290 [Planctomycetota bacterium]|jgi:hypothetical protein